jgi:predicted RecA/RadA family phage recombinase
MKNQGKDFVRYIAVTVAAGVVSGDPVKLGDLTGVAYNDRDAITGKVSIDRGGSYKLTVYGHDGAANSAVAEGDRLYLDAANKRLHKKATDTFFGWAAPGQAVAGGATAVIEVIQKNGGAE